MLTLALVLAFVSFFEVSLRLRDLRFPLPIFEFLSWYEFQYHSTLHAFQGRLQDHPFIEFIHSMSLDLAHRGAALNAAIRSSARGHCRYWAAFLLAGLWFGMAFGIKIYNVLFLPMVGVALMLGERSTRPMARRAVALLVAIVGFVSGFFATNRYLFPGAFQGQHLDKLGRQAKGMMDPNYDHATRPPGLGSRISHWIYNTGNPAFFDINTIGI